MATNPSVATGCVTDDEDPVIRALENAPLAGAEDFTPEELAHLEAIACEAVVAGHGRGTAEVLEMLAGQSKHRHE